MTLLRVVDVAQQRVRRSASVFKLLWRAAGILLTLSVVRYAAVAAASDFTPTGPSITLTPVYTYRIIATYPHDPSAFTQGLLFAEGMLYEGTGWYGASSVRRVELTSGTVLQQHNLDAEYFGEGIAVVSDTLYQLTWQNRVAFTYDKTSFRPLGVFSYTTEGWGLTYDGQRLIMSDGSPVLYFRDPATFAVLGQITVTDAGLPVARLNELEYINGEVWANVWMTDWIARIDPASGRVTGWVDLSHLMAPHPRLSDPDAVLNGIAWDEVGKRLFVTGKRWPALFEIEVRRLLFLPLVLRS
ncbi:MAG: glutaminyl-peptide cyclotransferase [Anaerolineae bacterium]|nr:glutaminyl-peptide cyclotransferase [Thermoflexales bacterium]MDW8407260.1 glutaminyl-peptide cyclotransferase [Anaerolineae bacterium]